MSNLQDANRLRQQKRWKDARVIFDSLWAENKNQFNDWEVRHYAFVCKKEKDYERALELCEIVINRNPNFKPIYSEFYWNKYYTVLKVYPDDTTTSAKLVIANEIKERFIADRKYSPFNQTCLRMSEVFYSEKNYSEVIRWLSFLEPKNLDTTYSFTNNEGEEINFVSQRLKYFSILVDSYYKANQIDKCISICIEALKQYPTPSKDNNIASILASATSSKYGLKGENLINQMLANLKFADNEFRNSYRDKLISKSSLNDWENNFEYYENFAEKKELNKIGKAIYKLLKEEFIKSSKYSHKKEYAQNISSSEIGNFAFCPASYAITKSLETNNSESSTLKFNFEKQQNIGLLFKGQNKIENVEEILDSLAFKIEGNNLLREILSGRLEHSNINGINPKIFRSINKEFLSAPDNILKSSGKKMIVEEKFRGQNDNVISPFHNHILEVLNNIQNIDELNYASAYIVYWSWQFQRDQDDIYSLNYDLKGCSIFKVELNEKWKSVLSSTISKIRDLLKGNSISFNLQNINASKCAGCSVNEYCYHKTGRLREVRLPYRNFLLEYLEPKIRFDEISYSFLKKYSDFICNMISTHYAFSTEELIKYQEIIPLGSETSIYDSGAIVCRYEPGLIYNRHITWNDELQEKYNIPPSIIYAGDSDEYSQGTEFDRYPIYAIDILNENEGEEEQNALEYQDEDERYEEIVSIKKRYEKLKFILENGHSFSEQEVLEKIMEQDINYLFLPSFYTSFLEHVRNANIEFEPLDFIIRKNEDSGDVLNNKSDCNFPF